MYLEDDTGKPTAALTVFTESLKYFMDSLLREARRQQSEIKLQDIKWILIVPAIWSDPAKAFMRRAAVGVIYKLWLYDNPVILLKNGAIQVDKRYEKRLIKVQGFFNIFCFSFFCVWPIVWCIHKIFQNMFKTIMPVER